jgi:hypothetical protein
MMFSDKFVFAEKKYFRKNTFLAAFVPSVALSDVFCALMFKSATHCDNYRRAPVVICERGLGFVSFRGKTSTLIQYFNLSRNTDQMLTATEESLIKSHIFVRQINDLLS